MCKYLQNQKGRKDITKAYADNCKAMIKNQVLPYFGKIPLDRITSDDINQLLLGFKELTVINSTGEVIKRSYRNTYANYGYHPTKTKEKRSIPVAPLALNEIRQLAVENNNGYVFSLDGGFTRLPENFCTTSSTGL